MDTRIATPTSTVIAAPAIFPAVRAFEFVVVVVVVVPPVLLTDVPDDPPMWLLPVLALPVDVPDDVITTTVSLNTAYSSVCGVYVPYGTQALVGVQ